MLYFTWLEYLMMMIFLKIYILFKYQFRHNTAIFWYEIQVKEQGQKEEKAISPKTKVEKPQPSSHSLDRCFYKNSTFKLFKNWF